MFGFLKRRTPFLAFSLCFILVADCFAVTGTVTVSVSPGHQTVKTRGAGVSEEIGINTAEYTITASCDPQVETGEEVKPVEPSWTIASETKFLPPQGVVPVPTEPQNALTVSISGGNGDWTAKVHSSAAGEWKIIFTAEVTYKLWDTTMDQYARDDKGNILTASFSGEGTCWFKVTESKFKLEVEPSIKFPNRSKHDVGLSEIGILRVLPIDPNDSISFPLDSCENSNSTVLKANMDELKTFGFTTFEAISHGSTVVTATKGDSTDSEAVNVVLPNGFEAYGIERVGDPPNITDFFLAKNIVTNVAHNNGIASVGLVIYYYITPGHVCFPFLFFTETDIVEQGKLLGDPQGYFAEKYPNGIGHNPSGWGHVTRTDAPGFPRSVDPNNMAAIIRPNLLRVCP